ncbi:MAG: hypothetical protein ACI8PD_002044, partial [Nitrospinales bacterium]
MNFLKLFLILVILIMQEGYAFATELTQKEKSWLHAHPE